MGSFDGMAMLSFLFFLSVLGWSAEFFQYLALEVGTSFTGGNSNLINSWVVQTFSMMIVFLRSSYFYLVFALVLTNILLQAGTKLNPIWFGISVLVFFLILYFLENYIMGPLIQGLLGLNINSQVHADWFLMIKDLWFPSLLGVLIGSIFAYVKGIKGGAGYGITF